MTLWSSCPEEFHLQALPDPYVNLSIHTAPDVRPLADSRRLCLVHRLFLLPDGFSWPVASAEQRSPFGPAPLQSLSSLLRATPPLMLRIGTLVLAVLAACDFSLCIGAQVLTFRTKAWLSFAPPPCRMPLGPSQASPKLIPEV